MKELLAHNVLATLVLTAFSVLWLFTLPGCKRPTGTEQGKTVEKYLFSDGYTYYAKDKRTGLCFLVHVGETKFSEVGCTEEVLSKVVNK